jgi:hypothetical protein
MAEKLEGTGLDLAELHTEARALLAYAQAGLSLTKTEQRRLRDRLWRFSAHLRQPRKDVESCNKTPYVDRWYTDPETSHLTMNDPRYASREECILVFETLLALLLEAQDIPSPLPQAVDPIETVLGRPFQPQSLTCVHTGRPISGRDIKRALGYTTGTLGTYEIPVSYRVELNTEGRHNHANVGWMKPLHINYALRKILRADFKRIGASTGAISTAFDKIQVKSYCTDKQTMPPFFSNRDIRWATWPSSPQYASRYQCAMIEMELMAELYECEGAPELDKGLASAIEEARGGPFQPGTRRCFITGRLLRYDDYVEGAVNAEGGKSSFNVGHIMPLTRGGQHQWDNVAWSSDDGNRIQGNDTLAEIEVTLFDAVQYYVQRDMEEEEPPPAYTDRVKKLWTVLNEAREKYEL